MKALAQIASTVLVGLMLGGCRSGGDNDTAETQPDAQTRGWYQAGERVARSAMTRVTNTNTAKNIIVFVGSGMGLSTVTAARILDGQLRGQSGEENRLSFEGFPYSGLAKTFNTNQLTAILSGVRTKPGVIGVGDKVRRGDCASVASNELVSVLMLSEMAGKSTGIVTTTRLTSAVAAAAYATTPEARWEDDSALAQAHQQLCKDIARQLLEVPHGDGLEVALGGGRRHFLPRNTSDTKHRAAYGDRIDGRDLTEEWLFAMPSSAYVYDREQLASADATRIDHLLGLFASSHMAFEVDRRADPAGEPSLREMTAKALEILQKNSLGFFLLVNSGRIGHAHRAGDAYRALQQTRALADAVRIAAEKTDPRDTLIIVTADHGHPMTIAGYPTRGNSILGLVRSNDARGVPRQRKNLDLHGLPYSTLSYTSVAGQAKPDETRVSEDVPIFARGPHAHLLAGVHEQNVLFHVMVHAGGLIEAAGYSLADATRH